MSIFGNLGRSMVAARQHQANKLVYSTLLTLDDAAIKNAGYTREELKRKAVGAIFY